MGSKQILLTGMFLILFLHLPLQSTLKESTVRWQKGMVESRGYASAYLNNKGIPVDPITGMKISLNKARNIASLKAREKAQGQLVKVILSLYAQNDEPVESFALRDEHFTRKVMDTIREYSSVVVAPKGFIGSECVIRLEISALIPVFPFSYPARDFPLQDDTAVATPYSSLIIDARGIGVHPMIFPALINEDGREIYNRHYVHIKQALKKGIITYVTNEKMAENHPIRGSNPYFSVALREAGGNAVLSNRDIRKIFSSKRTRKSLKNCNVIMIIDVK